MSSRWFVTGKPLTTIVVAPEPTVATAFAAEELQDHVRRITGATLKAIKPELRVIISSGYDEKTALEGMKPFVPDGFVQKPYRVRTNEDTLHQILSDN